MAEKPNPADFLVNKRDGEFEARFEMSGYFTVRIRADSQEAARRAAERMLDEYYDAADGGELPELDDFDDLSLIGVSTQTPMYLVQRGTQKMQVTHLQPGDLPREPDERGF